MDTDERRDQPTGGRGPAALARRTRSRSRTGQRGLAFLFTLLLAISVGVTLYVYGASTEVARSINADTRTQTALEQAREALVARAVSDSNRPGSLPCPDTDDDGSAELLVGVDCPSYIGRLPWRTLGLGDVRDSAGERLWYALSPNFRDSTAVQINSNTKGNRVVYGSTSATTITAQAVAVVFAPGTALTDQFRDGTSAACTMSGVSVTMRRDRCAANYLESDTSGTPAWSNARASGPFMSAAATVAFNDKSTVLRTTDFMSLVEQRVARDIREVLRDYRDASKSASVLGGGCDCFPNPDSNNDGVSDPGANRGRIPTTALPHAWGSAWVSAITGLPIINPLTGTTFTPIPSLPSYFVPNGWHTVIYYTVAKTSLQNLGASCTTCTANTTLSVDGASGYGVVLITPGPIAPSQTRTTWADYIDDAENRDGSPLGAGGGGAADPAANDAYVTPPQTCPTGQCPLLVGNGRRCVPSAAMCRRNVTDPNRDRIYTITAPAPNSQCGPNASTLIQSAPCHTTGNNVKPVCQQSADNLQTCSCSSSATTMITPPCRNTLNPPQCQAAVNTLKACSS